jgi:hypothetical protein
MEENKYIYEFLRLLLEQVINYLVTKFLFPLFNRFLHRGLSPQARKVALSFGTYSNTILRHPQIYIKGIGNIERPEIGEIESAWEGGVNGVILTGNAGCGKSGIVTMLANKFRKKRLPFLFIRATELSRLYDPAIYIRQRLAINMELSNAFALLGKEHECALIVDQLDSISGTEALAGLTSLMKSICTFKGVRVLGVSRTYEAIEDVIIKQLEFMDVKSHELTPETTKYYLQKLGLSIPSSELICIAQNLLNLSIISEVISAGVEVGNVLEQAQLWEKFIETIKEREGINAYQAAFQLADEHLSRGEREFSIPLSQISTIARLISRGVILQSSFGRYRFIHEQLQDFLCAYTLLPNQPFSQVVIDKYGKHIGKNVLCWIHTLYSLKYPDKEPSFVRDLLLNTEQISFYTQVTILDRYIHTSNIVEKSQIVDIILETLRSRNDLKDYFFRSGPNPAWAVILWENGFFNTPPTPQKIDEGYTYPKWDIQYYLYSVADQVPDIVIKQIKSIEAHGLYISPAIQALCKVPPERTTEVIPRIVTWLSTPQIAGFILRASQDLLMALIKAGQKDPAFEIFRALTTPVLRSEFENVAPSTHRGEPVVILYEDALGKDYYPISTAEELIKIDPRRVVETLNTHLKTALKLEAKVLERPEFEYSAGWRIAVEETGQDKLNDAKNRLLEVLLHAVETLVHKVPESAEELLRGYLVDDHKIIYRIGLYILQSNPTAYKQYVTRELLKVGNLDDTEIHHEFFLLLQQGFPSLMPSDQKKLVATILDGPPVEIAIKLANWVQKERGDDPDKYIQRFTKQWIRDRLWMIRYHIFGKVKEELNNIVSEIGEPEHPALLMWSSGGFRIQEVSPLPKEELALLAPNKLIDFLRGWKPDPNQPFGPLETSYRALARDLAETIHEDLKKYYTYIETIARIRPEYASALMESFLNSNQMSARDWEICINLCEQLLSNQSIHNRTLIYYEEDWRWVRMCMVRLIEAGLEKDSHKIPIELFPRARDLLLILIDDPDPGEEQDRPAEGWVGYRDPSNVALNHVRPSALGALIHYAWTRAKTIKEKRVQLKDPNQSRLEVVVKEALTKKLDRKEDPSRAVHSIFGRYLCCLYWLDQAWMKSNVDKIFLVINDEESLWFFVAAWDSFVIHNRYDTSLRNTLYSKYHQAINNLANQYVTSPEVASRLAVHLVFEFLLGDYDLNSTVGQNSLIVRYFCQVSPENRGAGAFACWIICRDNPNELDMYWPKVRLIWEWRVQIASAANHSSDFDDEMRNFAQLLLIAPEKETIKTLWPLLEGVLPHIVNDTYPNISWNSVEKFLTKEVKCDPVRSIQFYRLMRERKRVPFPGFYEADEAREILETAWANKDSREEALSIIDMLARSGNHKYRDIYDRSAP